MDIAEEIYRNYNISSSKNIEIFQEKYTKQDYITSKENSYLIMNSSCIELTLKEINHLTLRNCSLVNIILQKSMSGIDMINCQNITIIGNDIPFIEVWEGSYINVSCITNKKFICSYSLDIFLNYRSLNCNPFDRLIITN